MVSLKDCIMLDFHLSNVKLQPEEEYCDICMNLFIAVFLHWKQFSCYLLCGANQDHVQLCYLAWSYSELPIKT